MNIIENIFNYKFNNFNNNLFQLNTDIFREYELLGDSLLGFIVIKMLINKEKNDSKTRTMLKTRYVCNDTLSKISRKIGLYSAIMDIQKDKVELTEKNVADILEACIGIIYKDSNENINIIENIIHNIYSNCSNVIQEEQEYVIRVVRYFRHVLNITPNWSARKVNNSKDTLIGIELPDGTKITVRQIGRKRTILAKKVISHFEKRGIFI